MFEEHCVSCLISLLKDLLLLFFRKKRKHKKEKKDVQDAREVIDEDAIQHGEYTCGNFENSFELVFFKCFLRVFVISAFVTLT